MKTSTTTTVTLQELFRHSWILFSKGHYITTYLPLGEALEWIQVDFGRPRHLTGVITQGRGQIGKLQWVTSFRIAFSDDRRTFRNIKNAGGTDHVRNSYDAYNNTNAQFCSYTLNLLFACKELIYAWLYHRPNWLEKLFEREELNRTNVSVLCGAANI